MNQNEVAVEIAKKEGGKKNTNIAQIKEIVKIYNAMALKRGVDLKKVFKGK